MDKDSIVDKIQGNSKASRAKSHIYCQGKLWKSNNKIKLGLANLQLLSETSSVPDFLTSRVRLAFAKLR